MGFVDCHTHLPRRAEVTDRRNLPFLEGYRGRMDEGRPIEALLAEMDRGGIEISVVLGVLSAAGVEHDNDALVRDLEPHRGRLVPFGIVDPAAVDDPAREVERCVRELGCKGIGEWGYTDYTQPVYEPVYEACADLGVPLLVHTGAGLPAAPMRLGSPLLLDEVLVRHPRLTVIAAHCGAPWFMELAAVAVRHPNVWIDVSALPFYPLPVRYLALVSMIAAGLGSRLLFGSDFPVVSPADWAKWLASPWRLPLAARLANARFGQRELDGLLGGTARRLLGL